MWSFNYMSIPKDIQKRIALMFVDIRHGKVYQQCFGPCNGYYMMFAAMVYEFQKELETCVPDTNFWYFESDFIPDVKP